MPAAIRLCKTTALLLTLTLTAACTRTDISHTDALAKYQKGDYQTAFAAWQRLAEQGLPEAQYWLGTLYRKGEGVKRDRDASARWQASAAAALQPLAEQGQPQAQYLLGLMAGNGMPKDDAQSEWLRRAAAQGHANAQYALGLALFRDRPGDPDRQRGRGARNANAVKGPKAVEGEQWCAQAHDALLPLAHANDADAQHRITTLYRHGCGLAQDRTEYGRWLRRAARRGHVEAQYHLGAYHRSTLTKKRSSTEAANWLRRAAQKGHPAAQFTLAQLYEIGAGVRRSQTEAQAWYRKAAEQGYALAQRRLESLSEIKSSQQPRQQGKRTTGQARMTVSSVVHFVVEPGGIEPPSASPLQAVLHV